MTHKNHIELLSVSVLFAAEEVALDMRDRRPDSIALFGDLDEPARDQLAHDAWAIGLRALSNAHQAAQESKLKDVGSALLGDIDKQLKVYVEQQQQTIGAVLTRFFDPQDGQVTQRLSAFVDDRGVLARQLQKFLGPQGSVLAETLAKQVGGTQPGPAPAVGAGTDHRLLRSASASTDRAARLAVLRRAARSSRSSPPPTAPAW